MRSTFVTLTAALLASVANPSFAADNPVPETASSASTENSKPDFNGVWTMADYSLTIRPEDSPPPYTQEVQANVDRYKRDFDIVKDDPAQFCVLMGMPWRMLNRARDYPLEIYQTKERIFIIFEGHDDRRVIRLDRTTVPENLPQSANGWSNAYWEGQTLVVTTSNLTARTAINTLQRSEEAVVTERWNFRKDEKYGDVIEIDITIVDPPIYTKPVTARQVYKRSAPGVEIGGYNCADDLWARYLEAREIEISKKSKGKNKSR